MPNFIRKVINKISGGGSGGVTISGPSPSAPSGGAGGGASATPTVNLEQQKVVDRFCDNPLDFMQNNMVMTPEAGSSLMTGGVKFFTLTKQASLVSVAGRPGARVPVYMAHPCGSGGLGLFEAYWCPYEEGNLRSKTVGNLANFLFTAPMNGCSFGVGSAAKDGSRLVGHSNQKGLPGAWAQQNKVLKLTNMSDATVDPHVYMKIAGDDPVLVTTFGLRDSTSGSWRFYYQVNTTATGNDLSQRQLIGVFPIN